MRVDAKRVPFLRGEDKGEGLVSDVSYSNRTLTLTLSLEKGEATQPLN